LDDSRNVGNANDSRVTVVLQPHDVDSGRASRHHAVTSVAEHCVVVFWNANKARMQHRHAALFAGRSSTVLMAQARGNHVAQKAQTTSLKTFPRLARLAGRFFTRLLTRTARRI
jgi:hypothetical protein